MQLRRPQVENLTSAGIYLDFDSNNEFINSCQVISFRIYLLRKKDNDFNKK